MSIAKKQSNQSSPDTRHITWFALFGTTGTLVCCALPILLVSLGMGATVASLISYFPLLVVLSEHKVWVFSISALLLLLSFIVVFRPNRSCPTDPLMGQLCQKLQNWNHRILWLSVIIWNIGFFAAFLALPLQIWVDQL